MKRLYDFAGLDRRHWRIVGVDVGGRYSRSGALVWAVPRADGYVSAWRQIAQEGADSLRDMPSTCVMSPACSSSSASTHGG